MAEEEATKECSNCGAQIAESKLVLHESYCRRNLYRCFCGKMVDKREKQVHDDEFHTPVNCIYCQQPFEKAKIEEHQASCPKKPRLCKYCDLEVSGEEFERHVMQCGSRTNQCPKCFKFIQKMEWETHQLMCVPPPPKEPSHPPVHRNPETKPYSRPQAKPKSGPTTYPSKKPEVKKSFKSVSKKEDKKNVKKPQRHIEEFKEKSSILQAQEKLDKEIAERLQQEMYNDDPLLVPDNDPVSPPPAKEYKTEQLIPDRPSPVRPYVEPRPRPLHHPPSKHSHGKEVKKGKSHPRPENNNLEDQILNNIISESLKEDVYSGMSLQDSMNDEELQRAIQYSLQN